MRYLAVLLLLVGCAGKKPVKPPVHLTLMNVKNVDGKFVCDNPQAQTSANDKTVWICNLSK